MQFIFNAALHVMTKHEILPWIMRTLLGLLALLVVAACASDSGGSGEEASASSARDAPLTQEILSRYAADGTPLGFTIRELNANGIIRITNYTASGTLLNYQMYDYDAMGRAHRIGFYNATGGLGRYEVLAYDGNGRQSHHGFYGSSGALTRFEVYDYDARARRDYRGFYDAQGNLTRYTFYSYDATTSMDPTRLDFYDAAGNWVGSEIHRFNADAQHNRTSFYDATGHLIRYHIYTYNARKQLIQVATYGAGNDPNMYDLIGYDSYGYGDVPPPAASPAQPAPPPLNIPDADDRPQPRPNLPRPPATDMAPPQRVTSPPRPINDEDEDRLADVIDNCPLFSNTNQMDADGDGIGDVCEAIGVLNLIAITDGLTAVNLSWVNPATANLTALNLSYVQSESAANPTVLDITEDVSLMAGAPARYRISDLASATRYTFTIGGFDDRHGRIRQSLPRARVNGTTAAMNDLDNDGFLDDNDTCPRIAGTNQQDSDGDGIGDICEAEALTELSARPDARNATVVHLTWQNPGASRLTALNISYYARDTLARLIRIREERTLVPGARVTYRITDLAKATNYEFTVGGIDARHGRLDQFLPPAQVNTTTPADDDNDTIRDEADNCPFHANPGQEDEDGDQFGNACEAGPVTRLAADVHGTNAVNLSWTNPQDSVLLAMNITFGPRNDPRSNFLDITEQVNLSAGARLIYPIMGLDAGTTYTFTVGGIDFRHGRRNQTLESATRDATTLADTDGDGITDVDDSCPRTVGNQLDSDGNGIGDICEATAVSHLSAWPDGETTVNLRWTNPAGSDLQFLNISYGLKNTQTRITRVLGTMANLEPGAPATTRLTGLVPRTNYTLILSGLDARHGVLTQALPPATLTFNTMDRDGDGILDGEDNCIFTPNPDQTARSGEPTYGQACGPDWDDSGTREIQTADQLNASRHHAAARYELVTDVDLARYANWIPIPSFSGTLNGHGYTISNLRINSTAEHVGLFGRVTGQVRIYNITLRVLNIRASSTPGPTGRIGGLIGSSPDQTIGVPRGPEGPVVPAINAAAVIIEGNLTGRKLLNNYIGGFLGEGGLNLNNSYVLLLGGDISTTASIGENYVGGLVGWHQGGKIQNAYVLVLGGGSIRGLDSHMGERIGGLLGNEASLDFEFYENSYVVINGTITSTNGRVGGLTGFYLPASLPRNSYFAAPIAASFGDIPIRRMGFGSGLNRTLRQLECPTAAGATCAGATTYTNWDNRIWNFGDAQTLPDLRARPRPPDLRDPLP